MAAKYSALQVADWILGSIDRDAGDSITHLKLQKLLYYAQAWHLVFNDGEPLFGEDIQAWAHGPVVDPVFQRFKNCAWEAIPCPEGDVEFDRDTNDHLVMVMSLYGEFSAKHLEKMTHNEDPWIMARAGLPPEARSSAVISHESMISYYKKLYDQDNGES